MQSLKELCLSKIKYISPIHCDLYEFFVIFNKEKMLKELIEKTHQLYFDLNVRYSHCYRYSSFHSKKMVYYGGSTTKLYTHKDSNNYFGLGLFYEEMNLRNFDMLKKECHPLFADIKKRILDRTYDEITGDDHFIYRCDVEHVQPV